MTGLVEMVVESVRVHMLSNRHVVILKDSDGDRYLPIWIGPWEASAIAMRLQGLTPERPLTHDLFAAAIDALGVRIERIIIAALSEETFHARLVLSRPEGEVEIDARPSDALALAVRTNARIYAAEGVLEQAALGADSVLGDDADDRDEETADAGGSRRRGRPSLESFGDAVVDPRLDVFRDFVNSLDPDAGGGEGGRGRGGGRKRPD